jgi:hypothetical protein
MKRPKSAATAATHHGAHPFSAKVPPKFGIFLTRRALRRLWLSLTRSHTLSRSHSLLPMLTTSPGAYLRTACPPPRRLRPHSRGTAAPGTARETAPAGRCCWLDPPARASRFRVRRPVGGGGAGSRLDCSNVAYIHRGRGRTTRSAQGRIATLPSSTAKLTRQPTAICTLLSRATNTITPVSTSFLARSPIS